MARGKNPLTLGAHAVDTESIHFCIMVAAAMFDEATDITDVEFTNSIYVFILTVLMPTMYAEIPVTHITSLKATCVTR